MFKLAFFIAAAAAVQLADARMLRAHNSDMMPYMAPAMAPAPMTMPVAQQYMQCGGMYHDGASECAAGLACMKQNDYYSQCLRDGSMDNVAQQYEQCGGDEYYQGPTECTTDLTCVMFNKWYSQCLTEAPMPAMAPMEPPAMSPMEDPSMDEST